MNLPGESSTKKSVMYLLTANEFVPTSSTFRVLTWCFMVLGFKGDDARIASCRLWMRWRWLSSSWPSLGAHRGSGVLQGSRFCRLRTGQKSDSVTAAGAGTTLLVSVVIQKSWSSRPVCQTCPNANRLSLTESVGRPVVNTKIFSVFKNYRDWYICRP
jgi:hypothetical protein